MMISEGTQQKIQNESIFISLSDSSQLHLRHFWKNSDGVPVFMLHGAIENGRIFYSDSGKGLAWFLAEQGFDVYVGDLRGRGQSTPAISSQSQTGQTESIVEEIPAFIHEIEKRRRNQPQVWIAHSWGGVLLLSTFARHRDLQSKPHAMVFFGAKRSVQVRNLEKWVKIDLIWNSLARWISKFYGYLPAKKLRIGSDNETQKSLEQSVAWVKGGPWVDPEDQFDYGKSLKSVELPAILYVAGSKDYSLGHSDDVKRLIEETGSKRAEFKLLQEYGHIDMLTSPRAVIEHFVDIVEWIREKIS
jgi:predicted alpha/beta hydrolase